MSHESKDVQPGPRPRSVRNADGHIEAVPDHWDLLPPGDAGLTRRVKAAGPSWTVKQKKGRRTFSQGIWAPAETIAAKREELEAERSTAAYGRRRATEAARRERRQSEYVGEFREAVVAFLGFAPCYAELADRLADTIAAHATPVGSGTVARTQRIPVERRAESAVIAWLRHQTTAYDSMKIQRVKGRRREVRRQLAAESRKLLARYRNGEAVVQESCLLRKALEDT